MAILWNIVALDATVATGAINVAHWEASDYEVVDGVTHRGRRYGAVNLAVNVDAEDFIPWAEVTEENALAWTKSALGEEEMASIESCIANDIAESKVPVVTSKNPWVVAEQEAANEAALAAIAESEGGE